ncbi:MAG: EamA family transporter RarD [Paracoccaceae bacterium]
MANRAPQHTDTALGFAYALGAYVFWGFLPLYMKALAHVPTLEVLAHRVIWSVPVSIMVLLVLRRGADLRAALRSWRLLGMAAMTSGLIAVNWGIYVYAIQSGQALEAALGYYINPLFSILLGAVLLKERLSPSQWAAVALAAIAVGVLTWQGGRVPTLALALTLTWGLYAYLKRRLPLGPNQGFALEVLILLPLSLGYVLWLHARGEATFAQGVLPDDLLMMGLGLVTALPLMVYANAAKLLRLSTIGIMQYIAPTMIFLTAVLWFGEQMDTGRMIAFPMIWAALALYSVSLVRQARAAG